MTLFVDSSLCGAGIAAGWGSWAIRDGWPRGRFQGGPIELREHRVKDSTTAELVGIALALWEHNAAGELEGVHSIMIQCDSVGALSLIREGVPGVRIAKGSDARIGSAKSKHPVVPVVLKTIAKLLKGREVQVKHVKGHAGGETSRSWVNEQCDKTAKRHMRAVRAKIPRKGVADVVPV